MFQPLPHGGPTSSTLSARPEPGSVPPFGPPGAETAPKLYDADQKSGSLKVWEIHDRAVAIVLAKLDKRARHGPHVRDTIFAETRRPTAVVGRDFYHFVGGLSGEHALVAALRYGRVQHAALPDGTLTLVVSHRKTADDLARETSKMPIRPRIVLFHDFLARTPDLQIDLLKYVTSAMEANLDGRSQDISEIYARMRQEFPLIGGARAPGTIPLNAVAAWQQHLVDLLGPRRVELMCGLERLTKSHTWFAEPDRALRFGAFTSFLHAHGDAQVRSGLVTIAPELASPGFHDLWRLAVQYIQDGGSTSISAPFEHEGCSEVPPCISWCLGQLHNFLVMRVRHEPRRMVPNLFTQTPETIPAATRQLKTVDVFEFNPSRPLITELQRLRSVLLGPLGRELDDTRFHVLHDNYSRVVASSILEHAMNFQRNRPLTKLKESLARITLSGLASALERIGPATLVTRSGRVKASTLAQAVWALDQVWDTSSTGPLPIRQPSQVPSKTAPGAEKPAAPSVEPKVIPKTDRRAA